MVSNQTCATLFPFLCVFFAGESRGEDIHTLGLFTASLITTSWEFRENCAKFYLRWREIRKRNSKGGSTKFWFRPTHACDGLTGLEVLAPPTGPPFYVLCFMYTHTQVQHPRAPHIPGTQFRMPMLHQAGSQVQVGTPKTCRRAQMRPHAASPYV